MLDAYNEERSVIRAVSNEQQLLLSQTIHKEELGGGRLRHVCFPISLRLIYGDVEALILLSLEYSWKTFKCQINFELTLQSLNCENTKLIHENCGKFSTTEITINVFNVDRFLSKVFTWFSHEKNYKICMKTCRNVNWNEFFIQPRSSEIHVTAFPIYFNQCLTRAKLNENPKKWEKYNVGIKAYLCILVDRRDTESNGCCCTIKWCEYPRAMLMKHQDFERLSDELKKKAKGVLRMFTF